MHCDAHGFYRCGICETLENRNIRLERRIAELEKGIMKQHEENARLQDTIIYAKGRMKAYGIVDARIDLPGGWNEK